MIDGDASLQIERRVDEPLHRLAGIISLQHGRKDFSVERSEHLYQSATSFKFALGGRDEESPLLGGTGPFATRLRFPSDEQKERLAVFQLSLGVGRGEAGIA